MQCLVERSLSTRAPPSSFFGVQRDGAGRRAGTACPYTSLGSGPVLRHVPRASISTPTALGGRAYVDEAASLAKSSTAFSQAQSPSGDLTWRAKKFAFDQTAYIAHIPVAKRFG